jgi:predicted transcriptional regulator
MHINNNDLAVLRHIVMKQRRAQPLTHLQIACFANLTDRTVRNSIKRLRDANLITISDGKQGKAYRYRALPQARQYIGDLDAYEFVPAV